MLKVGGFALCTERNGDRAPCVGGNGECAVSAVSTQDCILCVGGHGQRVGGVRGNALRAALHIRGRRGCTRCVGAIGGCVPCVEDVGGRRLSSMY